MKLYWGDFWYTPDCDESGEGKSIWFHADTFADVVTIALAEQRAPSHPDWPLTNVTVYGDDPEGSSDGGRQLALIEIDRAGDMHIKFSARETDEQFEARRNLFPVD